MRVLIIGASGFIGYYIRRQLIKIPGFYVTSTYNSKIPDDVDESWYPLDITDYHQVDHIFSELQPDVVVLLAAVADVTTTETNQEMATEVNVGGTRHVARLCAQYATKLVFLSSEYVFGGDRGDYKENDSPDPSTHYGFTKAQAEKAVAEHASKWSIVRTSLVYGWPLSGRRNIATVVADLLKNGKTYIGDPGTYRTPIYVEHLTEGIIKLVANDHIGIFHIAGTDPMNMYEFGCAVAEAFDLDISLVQAAQPAELRLLVTTPTDDTGPVLKFDKLGLDCTQTNNLLALRRFDMVTGLQEMLTQA